MNSLNSNFGLRTDTDIKANLSHLANVASEFVLDTDAAQPCLFLVPKPSIKPSELEKLVYNALGASWNGTFIAVQRIPLTDDGNPDFSALRRQVMLTGGVQQEAWRQALETHKDIDKVAVCHELNIASHGQYSLQSLLPDWDMPSQAETIPPEDVPGEKRPPSIKSGPVLKPFPEGGIDEALQRAASPDNSSRCRFVTVDNDEFEMSYVDLQAHALRILGGLQNNLGLSAGDHALLHISNGAEFVAAFWACVLGGIVPVPITVPPSHTSANAALDKLRDVWLLLECPPVLCDEVLVTATQGLESIMDMPGLRVGVIETLANMAPGQHHQASLDDVALVLLTSGSTGVPKLVPLSHENLLSMAHGSIQCCGFTAQSTTLNWIPLDHVGAIIFLSVMPVVLGCSQIHISNELILREPVRWLDLIEKYRASISWAPNFAYGLIVDRAEEVNAKPRDLSCMKFLVNAGEANVATTVKEFLSLLQPHQLPVDALKPAFGMSETCSGITWSAGYCLDTIATDQRAVSLGPPIPGAHIRIVNDEGDVVPEGTIGHLQIKGPSVFKGYKNNSQENQKVFSGDWFTSGDLGFLLGGELAVTGRQREDIVIRGAKYYPHEIESVIETIDGVTRSCVAACSVIPHGAQVEELAIFLAIEADGDATGIKQKVRGVVANKIGIAPQYLVELSADQFPKTAIGKVQRPILRKRFEAGEFAQYIDAANESIGKWFYRPIWQPRAISAQGASNNVLVYCDEEGFAELVINNMLAEGWSEQQLILVNHGDSYQQITPNNYFLDCSDSSQHGELFVDLKKANVNVDQVVYFRCYSEQVDDNTDLLSLETRSVELMTGLLALTSALITQAEPTMLRIVASGSAYVSNSDQLQAERGLLSGLLATMEQEYPGARCQIIDLPTADLSKQAQRIVDELRTPIFDPVVCYREQRLVQRLKSVVPQPVTDSIDSSGLWQRGGHFIIIGGAGALGQILSRHLQQRYQANIVVVGRRQSVAVASGVDYACADVNEIEQLESVITEAEQTWGHSVDGIIHLAAEADECSLIDEAPSKLFDSQRAKLVGTLNLFTLIKTRPQTRLIQFGSAMGQFGGAGFGAYAAASSAQELITRQLSRGIEDRCVFLSWSQWQGLGLSHNRSAQAGQANGFLPLEANQALASLDLTLSNGFSHLFVGIDGEHPKLRHQNLSAVAPAYKLHAYIQPKHDEANLDEGDLFALASNPESPLALTSVPEFPTQEDGSLDIDRLKRLNSDKTQARTNTEAVLVDIWAAVLQTQDPGVHESFFELGGSSLSAASVVANVRKSLKVELLMSDVFSAPTIAELAVVITQKTAKQLAVLPEIVPLSTDAAIPLSFPQQRLWLLDRMGNNRATYNEVTVMQLDGKVFPSELERALQHVIARNDSLRTRFIETAVGAEAIIDAEATVQISVQDVCGFDKDQLASLLSKHAATPFDLGSAPLLRADLLRLSADKWLIQVVMHHIITDGWSLELLMSQWSSTYRALLNGQPGTVESPAVSYADFANWQRNTLQTRVTSQLDYWRKQLSAAPSLIKLPTDRPCPAIRSHRGGRVPIDINAAHFDALMSLGESHDASIFMTLSAVLATVLRRYTGESDVIFGLPVANRRSVQIDNVLGCFVNTLALRFQVDDDLSFDEFLPHVRDVILQALSNQDIPFEKLVEDLAPERHPGRNPLVQVGFTYHERPLATLDLSGVVTTSRLPEQAMARVDLELHLSRDGDRISGHWVFAEDLFDRVSIERIGRSFSALLEEVCAQSEEPLNRHSGISDVDVASLMHLAGDPASPSKTQISQLFQEQVQRTPDQLAVKSDSRNLTYRELDEASNQLAHHLQAMGVCKDVCVAQFVERSAEMIIGLLAIFKAGGVYVPLDPDHPLDRVNSLLEDSQALFVLTNSKLEGELPAFWGQVFILDDDWDTVAALPTSAPATSAEPHDAAYIIYTSGSTGRPKGVVIGHDGFCDMIREQISLFQITPSDNVAQFASCGFDASLSEMFMALLSGACLVAVNDDTRADPASFLRFMNDQRITVVTLPPTYLRLFNRAPMAELRVLLSAGEAADVDDLNFYSQTIACFNAYGPAESSVCATVHKIDPAQNYVGEIPIGQPLGNCQVLVMQGDQLAALGAVGELCIAGTGLAIGYLGQPELTEAQFIPHPSESGKKMYRTGDLARWNSEGQLVYCGRKDNELKVRGHRVSPMEIEQVLDRHPQVSEASVVEHTDSSGELGFAAYYCARPMVSLWPSVAEFFVYDDVLYQSMATHQSRNDYYMQAFRRYLPGQSVVEIGPGPEAVLARMCIEAGATKVYCIEYLQETYDKAQAKVESLGLSDRIILIHGNAMDTDLPEKVDWCVSEIVGSIGGSEGAMHIIDSARRFLHQPENMLPRRSVTRIAAVSLPEIDNLAFSEVSAHYVEKIFESKGYPFDLRLCVKNSGRQHILSTDDVFEDLDFTQPADDGSCHDIDLNFLRAGTFHGFLAWLTLATDSDLVFDSLDSQNSWLPVFLPATDTYFAVSSGDRFVGTVERSLSENGLNPDYRVRGTLHRNEFEDIEIDYTSHHDAPQIGTSKMHKRLLSNPSSLPVMAPLTATSLRVFAQERLPRYMLPTSITEVESIPMTNNGKVDKQALPEPKILNEMTYQAPRDETESILADIWQEVLGIPKVGINDNFFDLGGHSLRMIKIHQLIETRFGVSLNFVNMFEFPTIDKLAAALRSADKQPHVSPPETQKTEASRADRRLALARQRESRRSNRTRKTHASSG
ncbi:MAG: amino acid adenylation domain-containing protein [Arenicella sp.]